jgi:legumain
MYIEACESGSMFDGLLPNDLGIFVITAANPTESSWGTYCYPNDVINGTHINTCLGDLFSVNWLEDTELVDPKKESIE